MKKLLNKIKEKKFILANIIVFICLVGLMVWTIWLNIELSNKKTDIERLNAELRSIKSDMITNRIAMDGLQEELTDERIMSEYKGQVSLYFATKLDELNAIFLDYDQVVGDLDYLFKQDCYSHDMDSTIKEYNNILEDYGNIVERYLVLDEEIRGFIAEEESKLD